jgi:hypothetical protein
MRDTDKFHPAVSLKTAKTIGATISKPAQDTFGISVWPKTRIQRPLTDLY